MTESLPPKKPEPRGPVPSPARRFSWVACFAGLAAGMLVLMGAWQLNRTETARFQEQVRGQTVQELAAVRGAVEVAVNSRVHLTRGLKAHVSLNPDLANDEFAAMAALLMREAEGIRSVTLIKDNTISDVYPREGNEGALGLNLLAHPEQRAAALHAIETGRPWLSGPIDLVQGGQAFVNRAPVYVTEADGPPGQGPYWGMVSILIDRQVLADEIQESVPPGLAIAIRGRTGAGEPGKVFLGNPKILESSPIETEISLPTGSWKLYGIPKAGWPATAPGAVGRMIGGGVLAAVVGSLVFALVCATQQYRDFAQRLQVSNEQARAAQALAERASRLSAEQAARAEQYAHQVEAAQAETLRVMRDIEAARQSLADANEELARSNEELEQFAYVASHDLQEPLRKVSSFCELLSDEYSARLDDTGKEYVSYIVNGAQRMRELIRDLLSYSRINSQPPCLQPVDAGEALDEALYNLEGAIDASHAVVTHDPLPTVSADPRQLTQLFQNLVGNGIKYQGDDPPKIHVGVDTQDDQWVFSVTDNGIGIDPQFHQRVFGIFKRLHPRKAYPGTGIGLAICQRIVQRWDGRIWVESEAGAGATFKFAIPNT